jgi:hypothetical protein
MEKTEKKIGGTRKKAPRIFFALALPRLPMTTLPDCVRADTLGLNSAHEATLRAIKTELPPEALNWAAQQLAAASSDDADEPIADRVVRCVQLLAKYKTLNELLCAWTTMFRDMRGLSPIDDKTLSLMIAANAIAVDTPSGFSHFATQLVSPSVRITTETHSLLRKSTPPLRVSTPPSALFEQGLR